jgi:hypothetical protein
MSTSKLARRTFLTIVHRTGASLQRLVRDFAG